MSGLVGENILPNVRMQHPGTITVSILKAPTSSLCVHSRPYLDQSVRSDTAAIKKMFATCTRFSLFAAAHNVGETIQNVLKTELLTFENPFEKLLSRLNLFFFKMLVKI